MRLVASCPTLQRSLQPSGTFGHLVIRLCFNREPYLIFPLWNFVNSARKLSRSSLSPPSLWLLVDANHRLRRQSLSGHAVVLGLAAGPVSHGWFHGDARVLLRLDAVAAGMGKLVLCFLFWIMTANLQQA